MKNSLKLSLFLIAAISLALPCVRAQASLQTPTAEKTRSEPRTVRLIDLHDLLLADAAYPDFEEPAETKDGIGKLIMDDELFARIQRARDSEGTTSRAADASRTAAGSPNEPSPTSPALDDAGKIAKRAEQWQTMLRLWIEPPLSPELDRLELLVNGTLVAQLPAEGHAWLDRFIALQRGERSMFTSDFKILVGPRGCFDSLLPKPGAEDAVIVDLPIGTQVLSIPDLQQKLRARTWHNPSALAPADMERLLAAAPKLPGVDFLNSPKLTMFTRSRGNLSTYDKVEYVKDWNLRVVEPGHRTIAVPQIASVRDGLGVSVRGALLDANRLGLEVELWRSVLRKPIRTANVRLDVDGGRDVEVALPEVDTQRMRSHVLIELGGSVYFRGPGPSDDKEMLVLLTVTPGDAPAKKDK